MTFSTDILRNRRIGRRCRTSGRHSGFTLIELLIVIAIVLILAVTVVPNIGAGIAGTQLATASRSLVQAARFARTMALLHQVEMELVLVSAAEGAHSLQPGKDGRIPPGAARIEVRVVGDGGSAIARPETGSTESDPEDTDEPSEEAHGASSASAAQSTGEALGGFAGDMNSVFACGGIVFEFTGFLDEDEEEPLRDVAAPKRKEAEARDEGGYDEESGLDIGERRERLSFFFESDGTCRPFEVKLKDGSDGAAFTVKIDRWGKGEVLRDEE